ncbi:MAG: sulfite exporter TauE/SafE family protein [Nitrospinota bacterium]
MEFGLKLAGVGAIAFAVGFIGAMAGLVLGSLRLPVVVALTPTPAIAAGTNIAISALSALSGTFRHWREGRVSGVLLASMGTASIVGAFVGGFYSRLIHPPFLLALIGVVLVQSGIRMGFPRQSPAAARRPPPSEKPNPHVRVLCLGSGLGLIIGLLGGMVGLVLGALRLPAMIRWMGVDPRIAAGTNMAIGFLTGVFGFLGHLLHAEFDPWILGVMGAGAMWGANQGARVTGRVDPDRLRRWIGWLLCLMGAVMLFHAASDWLG